MREATPWPNTSPDWEEVVAGLRTPEGDAVAAREFCLESPMIAQLAEATAYVRASFPPGRPLLEAGAETADVMALPKTDEDRRLLASILMHEEEDLTPETVEGAVRALRRIYLRRRLEEVQRELQRPGLSMEEKQALLQEKVRLKRALMDPVLGQKAS